jgi:hypothetical protein
LLLLLLLLLCLSQNMLWVMR